MVHFVHRRSVNQAHHSLLGRHQVPVFLKEIEEKQTHPQTHTRHVNTQTLLSPVKHFSRTLPEDGITVPKGSKTDFSRACRRVRPNQHGPKNKFERQSSCGLALLKRPSDALRFDQLRVHRHLSIAR